MKGIYYNCYYYYYPAQIQHYTDETLRPKTFNYCLHFFSFFFFFIKTKSWCHVRRTISFSISIHWQLSCLLLVCLCPHRLAFTHHYHISWCGWWPHWLVWSWDSTSSRIASRSPSRESFLTPQVSETSLMSALFRFCFVLGIKCADISSVFSFFGGGGQKEGLLQARAPGVLVEWTAK